jgi:hypothetical protein
MAVNRIEELSSTHLGQAAQVSDLDIAWSDAREADRQIWVHGVSTRQKMTGQPGRR